MITLVRCCFTRQVLGHFTSISKISIRSPNFLRLSPDLWPNQACLSLTDDKTEVRGFVNVRAQIRGRGSCPGLSSTRPASSVVTLQRLKSVFISPPRRHFQPWASKLHFHCHFKELKPETPEQIVSGHSQSCSPTKRRMSSVYRGDDRKSF